MNKQEFFLHKLREESDEIGKAAAKMMEFGPRSINPATGNTNREELTEEINHLYAAIEQCIELGLIDRCDNDVVEAKKQKVNHYYELHLKNSA